MAIGFPAGAGSGTDTSMVTAAATDVLAGKVIVDKDGNPLTGSMESMNGTTITPTNSQQVISCAGKYMNDDIVVEGVKVFKYWSKYMSKSGTRSCKYIDGQGAWHTVNLPYIEARGFGFTPHSLFAFTEDNKVFTLTAWTVGLRGAALGSDGGFRMHGGSVALWNDFSLVGGIVEYDHIIVPMASNVATYSVRIYGY